MSTLILCAGSQVRFNSDTPKQLMPFNGRPLLQRTIEQVSKATVVTHNPQIIEFCHINKYHLYYPALYNKCVNTLLSTQELWDKRVFVLLGDVYYNSTCLDLTYNCTQDLCAIGNGTEIFSMSFVPSDKIVNALHIASEHPKGKLWHFYRVCSGINIDDHKRDTKGLYFVSNDNTNDIDTLEEYERFKTEIEK